MEAEVLSCEKKKFTNRETGELREYYSVCIRYESVVGFLYSQEPCEAGDCIELQVSTNRDHKLILTVA